MRKRRREKKVQTKPEETVPSSTPPEKTESHYKWAMEEMARLLVRQQAARADAKAAEQEFRHLVQSLDAIVWGADPDRHSFTFVSQRAEAILGFPLERWLREPGFWAEHIVHPHDRQDTLSFCQAKRLQDHIVEYRARAADGRVVWLRDIVRVVRQEQDQAHQLHGVMIDITELKQAEKKLEERSIYLNALIENSPLAVVVLDSRHRVELTNPAFAQIFLYRPSEIIGANLDELIADDDMKEEAHQYSQQVLAGQTIHVTTQRRRKDGSVVDVEIHGVPLLVKGELTGVLGLYQDITQRRQAENALRKSQASLAEAQRIARLGNWTWDIHNNELQWSDEIYRIFGVAPQAFAGTYEAFLEAVHPDDRNEVQQAVRGALNEKKGFDIDHRIVRPDGSERTVHEQAEVSCEESGRPVRLIGTLHDITERRELEDQLRHAQKMEAVGRLAGGVAHDFNNLLMVIQGHSELMLSRGQPGDPLRKSAEEIRKATERASRLTHQLLTFSYKQVLQPRILSLNAVVEDIEKLLRRLIGEDIVLVTQLSPDLGNVRADPGQIEQVLMNLAVNARDAMPRGGKLTIETSNVELNENFARHRVGVKPGPAVMLTVSDTGGGMDPETLAHIFEPFFTTKEQGKGTGLGLAMVYGIVKQSGGYIWVYSEPEQGTVFEILFPRAEVEQDTPHVDAEPTLGPGTETVLVVEDEDAVRQLTREFLENCGYRVLEANNGIEAIEISGKHVGPIHLMVTDVVMPKMGGGELAERLRPERPEMKVIFVSGYADDTINPEHLRDSRATFLQKPFGLDTLARKVREILETQVH